MYVYYNKKNAFCQGGYAIFCYILIFNCKIFLTNQFAFYIINLINVKISRKAENIC